MASNRMLKIRIREKYNLNDHRNEEALSVFL
jgi:hypothetical protein